MKLVKICFDVAPDCSYRKSISYFLRTQQDFLDVFQLSKFNKGPHSEWKPFLPDNLMKEYRDLELFNREISEERKKYLAERQGELQEEFLSIDAELNKLESTKGELLSVLKDKDSYEKFKHYQKSLVKIEADIARLEERLTNLDKIGELEDQVEKLHNELKEQAEIIKGMIARRNTFYNEIRMQFDRIIRAVEGLDNRKKINFLEIVREICRENDLQYLLTVIDSDIPRDEFNKSIVFKAEEIVLRLHDRDDTGRLFRMAF